MDGSVCLINHKGTVCHMAKSHDQAVSVLCCHGDRVIVGSCGSGVHVYQTVDLGCVTSLDIHDGDVTNIVCVEVCDVLVLDCTVP